MLCLLRFYWLKLRDNSILFRGGMRIYRRGKRYIYINKIFDSNFIYYIFGKVFNKCLLNVGRYYGDLGCYIF